MNLIWFLYSLRTFLLIFTWNYCMLLDHSSLIWTSSIQFIISFSRFQDTIDCLKWVQLSIFILITTVKTGMYSKYKKFRNRVFWFNFSFKQRTWFIYLHAPQLCFASTENMKNPGSGRRNKFLMANSRSSMLSAFTSWQQRSQPVGLATFQQLRIILKQESLQSSSLLACFFILTLLWGSKTFLKMMSWIQVNTRKWCKKSRRI